MVFPNMLKVRCSGMVAFLTLALAGTASAAPEQDQLARAADMKDMVATLKDGRAGMMIRQGGNYMIFTVVRAVPGDPELHEGMADLFMVQEGRANIRVGGKLVDGKLIGPGEWAGGRVDGGEVRHVTTGDMLWVPAGQPHQVTPSGGAFRYIVVKIAKAAAK